MKRICVFSDSHGCADHMLYAIRAEGPDMIIHLGDGEADLAAVRREFPEIPLENVRGNCDPHSTAWVVLRTVVEGRRIFATHGNKFEVKYDPVFHKLLTAAMEDDADIVLFGHTHVPYTDRRFCMDVMNPGTVGDVACPTYGLLTIDDGAVTMEIREAPRGA